MRGASLLAWLVRRRRPVLWLALLAATAGACFAARLYGNLRSGFEELLPDGAPSVVAARTLGARLRGVTHLSVVLEGDDPPALRRLADDLAARLRRLPPALVAEVDYRTDAQEAFIRRFGGLYLPLADLRTILAQLDRRIAWEKERANPLLDLLGEDAAGPAPPIDLDPILARVQADGSALARFTQGYYQTPDGRLLVLLVRPPDSATGLEANRRVLEAVQAEVKALDPSRYHPSLRVGYDGEVATLVEEQEALVGDLFASTAVVLVLVLLSLWAYFRSRWAILAISAALGCGCALTFGLAWFLVGYLNANTAFLGSIVVGNGINVSIIVVARYLEARRAGLAGPEALGQAWHGTMKATAVASLAAAAAYLSLAATDFRGFSQFGLIGALGMALCWLTAYLLLPPLLTALDRGGAPPPPPLLAPLGNRLLALAEGRAGAVAAIAGLLLLLGAAGVLQYRGTPIEYDLDKLRAARSTRDGAQFWGHKVDQVFRAFLTPVAIWAPSPAALERVLAELERARREAGAADPLREVRSLSSAVPPDQEPKLLVLAQLRERLTDARLARLPPELGKKLAELRPPADLRPVTLADLPESVRLLLTERDGTTGRIALAFPRKVGAIPPDEMLELTALIRGAIDRAGVEAQASGQVLLFVDIAAAILRDGPRATALALLAVVALVALSFRRLRPAALVVGSLLLGVAWLVGLGALAGVRLDFLNFVVLPITFGIGVDYAVNMVQRFRLEPSGEAALGLRETGGAVTLCSLTTVIGYGSLLAADNRALRGFGLLASMGEVACLGAALLVLPAVLLGLRRASAEPLGAGK